MHRVNNIADQVTPKMPRVYILSYSRTPIGTFGGRLSDIHVSDLAACVIKDCFEKDHVRGKTSSIDVDEVILGHVLPTGCGQAPARQAAIKAGLPVSVPCTSVNKVCASGMKALSMASESIQVGRNQVCIAGGMESMSRVPFLTASHRKGKRLGDDLLVDGLIHDGLWDVYSSQHMGNCAEKTARDLGISRTDQDAYAALSSQRAIEAHDKQVFCNEIVGIMNQKETISSDEQLSKLRPSKLSTLKPAFSASGSITAGNASSISDGAAAILISGAEFARNRNISPIAEMLAWADGECEPIDFGIAPAIAIKKALSLACLRADQIDLWEINEAFAAVVLANAKLVGNIPISKVNVFGGAISLGHPLGCSGARIVCTLLTAMKAKQAKLGCAAICNGGGGSTAVIIRMC